MRRFILVSIITVLAVLIPSRSHAEEDVCAAVPPLELRWIQQEKLQDIFNYYNEPNYLLNTYGRTFLSAEQNVYCFNIKNFRDEPLAVSNSLIFEKKDDLDVQLKGLKLQGTITQPILRVVHSGAEGRMLLQGISVENGGLSLEAKMDNGVPVSLPEDAIEVNAVQIVGLNKTNDCLTISAPGTILDDVEISNCAEGVRVAADNVQIRNSEIHENKVGVHVTNGYQGTKFRKTLIYANDDGSDDTNRRFDALLIDLGMQDRGILRDLRFFDVIEEEIVSIDPDREGITYEGNEAIVLLPEAIEETGEIELYYAQQGLCSDPTIVPLGQPCAILADKSMALTPESFEDGVVRLDVPLEKELVVVYSTPNEGTAAISQQFKLLGSGGISSGGEGGVVAFVQTPYDIPTPGGGVDDIDVGAGGTDEIEVSPGGGGSGMDSGGSNPIGAGPTAKCSLVPHAQRGLLGGFGTLWWIFAALAALGTTRLSRAHIRRN